VSQALGPWAYVPVVNGRCSRGNVEAEGDTLRVVTMKAELKGHEFDLDALVHLFPSGPDPGGSGERRPLPVG
jgi:hypothetical protein